MNINSKRIVDPTVPHGYRETLSDIKHLIARYPEQLRRVCCGKSVMSRDIPLLRLGKGKRNILAVSSIHAREFVTIGFLLSCAEDILSCYARNQSLSGYDVSGLLHEFSIYLVPIANPDGVETALGRQVSPYVSKSGCISYKNNANNVNLNANFPFEWGFVPKSRQGGEHPGSECETKFLTDICTRIPFDIMLSFHSRGNCLYWRDSTNGVVALDKAVANELCRVCGYELCPVSGDIAGFSGGFENWFRCKHGRVGLCVELVTDENADFLSCCYDFYKLTNYERTRLTLLCAADILSDFQLFIA